MPSVHRFTGLRKTVRSHPVIVATTAATGGVLLGAFVMFQIFAPAHPQDGSMQAAAETKPAPKAVAASIVPTTTGAAVAGETTATTDCDQQTWPNLSRVCMEQMREKSRTARTVSTDNRPVAAIEKVEPAVESKPVGPAPVAQPVASVTPPVEPVVSAPSTAADPAPPAAVAVATPEPRAEANPQPRSERAAKKAKVKKAEPKVVVKRDADDDDESAVASDDDDVRPVRRADRSRRIVEGWTERDYDVRADDGDGQRRITVIRRARSGGPLEALFGIGRGDDD